MGESFYFHMTIQNLTCGPLKGEISFQVNPKQCAVCSDDSSLPFSVPAAELWGHSFLCQALKEGTAVCSAVIIVNGKAKRFSQRITVIDEEHLGWSGDNALKLQSAGKKHLDEKKPQPLVIAGGIGTGKSTLVEILLNEKAIQGAYKVLKIDWSLPRNICARALLSRVLGMKVSAETPEDQKAEESAGLALLASKYVQSTREIAQTLMGFYDPQRPFLFVVDDIQNANELYCSLICELDDYAQKKGYPIYFLFTLNEESQSFEQMREHLNWDKNFQDRECTLLRTAKFGRSDILAYMKTKYGLEGIERFFDGIEKEISPLDLRDFCTGLKRERIIAQIPGEKIYQIVEPLRFSDALRQRLYAGASLKDICAQTDHEENTSGRAAYLLKHLYIADSLPSRRRTTDKSIIQKLIDYGVLREKGDAITFYHERTREAVKETLKFAEEEYADIFDTPGISDAAKAICALEQLGRLKNGSACLKALFASDGWITKSAQRYQICDLIFRRLKDFQNDELVTTALQFVNAQLPALREEQSHTAFFELLKHIAKYVLQGGWDINEKSTQTVAFLIKKFFDRALSTHNEQECSGHFEAFESLFLKLEHISEGRRYFWLSHYANRAAIAEDRKSDPLTAEPDRVKELYDCSERYSQMADEHEQLALQIAVDNFNRHYVYRHDLTPKMAADTLEALRKLECRGLKGAMVLTYHLLLLEYLSAQEMPPSEELKLLDWVSEVREKSDSPFYTMKLYLLELTLLAKLGRWAQANARHAQALELAYKKGMRQFIYKLTYIKTFLTQFEKGEADDPEVYRLAVLAMRQMLHAHENSEHSLKREVFLLVELMDVIDRLKPNAADKLDWSRSEGRELLDEIYGHVQGKSGKTDDLLCMKSYFVVNGISFPTI